MTDFRKIIWLYKFVSLFILVVFGAFSCNEVQQEKLQP